MSEPKLFVGRSSDGCIVISQGGDPELYGIAMSDQSAAWVRDELSKLLPRDPRLVAFDNFVEGFVKGLGSKDLEALVASGILDPAQLSAFVAMIQFVMDEDLGKNEQEKEEAKP